MSFFDIAPVIIRTLINDPNGETYDDDRINNAILTASIIVSQEYPFDINYSFDFSNVTITPDPSDSGDNLFIALVSLKAACILAFNTYQNSVGQGVKITDFNQTIDTTASFAGWKSIVEDGVCASYQKLLDSNYFTKAAGKGGAILGPYSNGDWPSYGYCPDRVPYFFNALVF